MLLSRVHHGASRSWRSLQPLSGRGWSKVAGGQTAADQPLHWSTTASPSNNSHRDIRHISADVRRPSYTEKVSLNQGFTSQFDTGEDSSPIVERRTSNAETEASEPTSDVYPRQSALVLRKELLDALHEDEPERILSVAIRAFRNPELLASLPTTTIDQVFESLRFDALLDQYKAFYWLTPNNIEHARRAGWNVRTLRQVFDDLLVAFSTLFDEWLASGQAVTLNICKSYLRLASAMNNADAARRAWATGSQAGLQWDAESYNLLLEAIAWESAYNAPQASKLRVTDAALSMRIMQPKNMPQSFQGHTSEVKNEAMDIFEEMVQNGFAANSYSFGLLMVSMGRVGDLRAAEELLKRVWSVDVDAIREKHPSDLYVEKKIPPDSPLYPSEDLLFCVAHTFGINNDFGTALRLVDCISRQYSLRIGEKTAEELLRWCYVLSRSFGGSDAETQRKRELQQSLSIGKIEVKAFAEVYDLLVQPPYLIRTSLLMYYWRFGSMKRQGSVRGMCSLLRHILQDTSQPKINGRLRDPTGSYIQKDKQPTDLSELDSLHALGYSAVVMRAMRAILAYHPTSSKNDYYLRFIPKFLGEHGNHWFQNTHRAFFLNTIESSGVMFHRRMQDENLAPMELFSAGKGKFTVARMSGVCMTLSFRDKSQSARREDRRLDGLANGENLQYQTRWNWYDRTNVRDWIWFSSGHGHRLSRGAFDETSGHFQPSPSTLRQLTKDEQIELQNRVAKQSELTA